MTRLIPFVAGLLFGLGLAVSNMLNPQRVLAFLDVFGVWDPTLALVMGGALLVTVPGFFWVLKRQSPVCETTFDVPTNSRIDTQLLLGASLFGLGWGMAGLCPGPAIAALVTFDLNLIGFVAVMLASWLATDQLLSRR